MPLLENDPDKVWCSIEQTINLGNYENVKVQVGTSRTIGGEDPAELRSGLLKQLLDEVETFSRVVRRRNMKTRRLEED